MKDNPQVSHIWYGTMGHNHIVLENFRALLLQQNSFRYTKVAPGSFSLVCMQAKG